jgi:cysteinyl-tRNA synthetase
MPLMLYDTYERRLRPFDALASGRAGLYACGPTVYATWSTSPTSAT